jgi:carnitine 3-dehydrogenase
MDAKRMHIYHELFNSETGKRLSNCEQMLVHVDMKLGKSAPILPNVAEALTAIYEVHKHVPTPENVGRVMKIKHK